MLKEETSLKIVIIALSLIVLSVLMIWNKSNQDNIRLQSKVELIREEKLSILFERDSLELELFNAQNALGRYDMVLDSMKLINPKAEAQFYKILNSGQYE